MPNKNRHAHFDDTMSAVVIERLTVRDKDVAREAQRWTAGERGPIVYDPTTLAEADLSQFVTEAVKIGAHALSAAGQAHESRALEQMLKEVGEKAADSTNRTVENTERRQEGHRRCSRGHRDDRLATRKMAEYFDEAERNRHAVASLGVVRTPAQNGGQSIRIVGPRRIVLAFDPESDDPELLRTAVMMLRASALAASARKGAHQIATAEGKITEAMAWLAKLDEVTPQFDWACS